MENQAHSVVESARSLGVFAPPKKVQAASFAPPKQIAREVLPVSERKSEWSAPKKQDLQEVDMKQFEKLDEKEKECDLEYLCGKVNQIANKLISGSITGVMKITLLQERRRLAARANLMIRAAGGINEYYDLSWRG